MKAELLLSVCLSASLTLAASGAESHFRANDIVALIGGEDMVALAGSGLLEAQIVRQPGLAGVKVRALAYEGDTVFEQHRQLNHPSWEAQLEKIGATVVVVQFGQMEALRADYSPDEFIQAYEALLKRLIGTGRRCVILSPTAFEPPRPPLPDRSSRNEQLDQLLPRLRALADRLKLTFVDHFRTLSAGAPSTRDGLHLNDAGLRQAALAIARQLSLPPFTADDPALLRLLAEKNRLWFNYHRPQNWAFLNGDRTEQLFSRDYRDTSVRLLPRELEEYVPLIAAKEREIVAHLRGIPAEKN